jgi:hypothetical protein
VDDRAHADAIRGTLVGMTFAPIIRTQNDLEQAWRQLMGPWGYGRHSLWLMVIQDDDVPVPQLTEIDECVEPPDAELTSGFAHVLGALAGDLGGDPRFAVLRTRPGTGAVTDDDRAWARCVYDAAAIAEVACEIVHLGTEGSVKPLLPDEVIVASA